MDDELFQAATDRLDDARSALSDAVKLVDSLNMLITNHWKTKGAPPRISIHWKTREMAEHCDREAEALRVQLAQAEFNTTLARHLKESESWPIEEYANKKATVRMINDWLREHNAAIRHPSDGSPCLLLFANSHDKKGRYTLEYRETKKRSGSYKTILELLPISLVPDIPRKEGVIERRKKKQDPLTE